MEQEKLLVIFELAGESYGIEIASVESIIKVQPITTVPFAPPFVEGVTNLRGVVLPVVDLRKRFGLAAAEINTHTRIVIVEVERLTVGMVVDAVAEVLRIPAAAIEPPSPLALSADSGFITGIARFDERLIILLDLDKVLSYQEVNVLATLQPV